MNERQRDLFLYVWSQRRQRGQMNVSLMGAGLGALGGKKCPGVSCGPSRSCVLMPSRADADLAAAAPSGGRALRQRKPSLDVPPSDRCEAGIPRRRAHGVPEDSSDGANVTAPPRSLLLWQGGR